MTLLLVLLLVGTGLLAGVVGSLAGLGGGVIIVPSLLFLAEGVPALTEMSHQVAVGTSLFVIVFTAISSTFFYAKQRRVDFSSGLLFFLASGPGSIAGAWLTGFVSSDKFSLFFGFLLLFMAFVLSVRNRIRPRKVKWHVVKTYTEPSLRASHAHTAVIQTAGGLATERTISDGGSPPVGAFSNGSAVAAEGQVTYGYNRWVALSTSFVVGLLAGFFGIGGGALLVPMMMIFFFFPAQVATATSMFTILLTSILGSVTHVAMGHVHWLSALCLIPGAWAGGWLGSWIAARISSSAITWVARIAIAIVGIDMVIEGMMG